MLFRRNKRADKGKPRRKGQALVEMALMGILLGMLLAGAVDLGRAYYTSVVVTNMAGEGAAFAAINPDKDANSPVAGQCSRFSVLDNDNIQDRARRVAKERGLIIREPQQADIAILGGNGSPSNCNTRCAGSTITVKVTYTINDLFLPGLLGMRSITIGKSSSQVMTRNAFRAEDLGNCQ